MFTGHVCNMNILAAVLFYSDIYLLYKRPHLSNSVNKAQCQVFLSILVILGSMARDKLVSLQPIMSMCFIYTIDNKYRNIDMNCSKISCEYSSFWLKCRSFALHLLCPCLSGSR